MHSFKSRILGWCPPGSIVGCVLLLFWIGVRAQWGWCARLVFEVGPGLPVCTEVDVRDCGFCCVTDELRLFLESSVRVFCTV